MVTRFAKCGQLVEPGVNWKGRFIDGVKPVMVEAVRELAASGVMLSSDENVVRVEMNVQYLCCFPTGRGLVRYYRADSTPCLCSIFVMR